MKFGVSLVPHDLSETAASARLAEDLGFDYVGIPDSQSLWKELYMSLGVVAGATNKVGIGPTVTNALTRHPAVAASAIATLNEMSGGRAYFGIGSGDSAILNLGLRPARLKELQEYIEAIRTILSGGPCDYKGRSIHVHLTITTGGVLHLGGGIRGLGARVRVGGKTPPGCTTRKNVFEKTPPLAAVAKRNPRCAERNPKVSTTTRACLSQTGAGWWLTPFGAPVRNADRNAGRKRKKGPGSPPPCDGCDAEVRTRCGDISAEVSLECKPLVLVTRRG